MMDNEEPQLSEIANLQISHEGHKLPEQSRVATTQSPRGFDFDHLIRQWQPMGIRVKLAVPFYGNDQDYIFAIRNGPFIPSNTYIYQDSSGLTDVSEGDFPDPTKRKLTTLNTYQSYAWNNMINVTHAYDSIKAQTTPSDQFAVTITQFDEPPILSSLATMFRRWRGTMHYRLRVVAGFTTQGYIFVTLVRNSPSLVLASNPYSTVRGVKREDSSYRESMINSYVMGDTAMFRHFEFQVPYEYPTPYYDQFSWIGKRTRPAKNFAWGDISNNKGRYYEPFRPVKMEPHGDNYILVGLRGDIQTTSQNSQITFEIEYRAGDDFQFADPFLPFPNHYLRPFYRTSKLSKVKGIVTIPDDKKISDGVGEFQNKSTYIPESPLPPPPSLTSADQATRRLERLLTFEQQQQLAEAKKQQENLVTQGQQAQRAIQEAQIRERELQAAAAARAKRRNPRSLDEVLDGHDEVDSDYDDASVASDVSDLSELRQPLRKSLRNRMV
ncbi:putative capsid protein [Lasius neglectus virus 1]|uniref:Putative capsid protein n=1 Tax=Lasius neglectus virus 1 TaxID=2018501 RepID=A0A220QTG0_9VIRU|nr:putative capsid protein [Lasius neglectus virus 1]ASK12199.1 putative capsid protein [Lasius neglectus virus 1]